MRLVIGGVSGSAPKIDSAILKATARARRWLKDLVSGRAASMVEIGQREGVGNRYVSRMIRLAFSATAASAAASSLRPIERQIIRICLINFLGSIRALGTKSTGGGML
jgi:hypothetical protein